MRRLIAAIFLLGSLTLATGCGQTGPLYLPEIEPPQAVDKEPGAEEAQATNTGE